MGEVAGSGRRGGREEREEPERGEDAAEAAVRIPSPAGPIFIPLSRERSFRCRVRRKRSFRRERGKRRNDAEEVRHGHGGEGGGRRGGAVKG
jgi:hypothetical protein